MIEGMVFLLFVELFGTFFELLWNIFCCLLNYLEHFLLFLSSLEYFCCFVLLGTFFAVFEFF